MRSTQISVRFNPENGIFFCYFYCFTSSATVSRVPLHSKRAPSSFTEFYWVLPSFTGGVEPRERVAVDSMEPNYVLLGFTEFLAVAS